MDSGDLIYLAFFAFWLWSQVSAVRKRFQKKELEKQQGQQQPPPQTTTQKAPPPIPAPQPVPTPQGLPSKTPAQTISEGLVMNFDDLEAEIGATLLELDEPVRAQVSFLVDNDYRGKAEKLRRELTNESSPEMVRAVQETKWLLSHYRGVLQTGRVHTGIRKRRELQGPGAIADRFAAELDQPRNVTHPLPPPVAIVWDVTPQDRLRESALADATLFVPRTVSQDPSHWSLVAPEVASYVGSSAPALYQDIYEGLGLGVAEAQIGNDPASLARVLFSSWIGRIVADATGALLFGPSYLLSIAQLYAQPDAPARVTSIALNQDGTVHSEPPAHVRVHVTASWVARMGYASEAESIQAAWDERHGSPDVLGFWGSMTSLPAAPVLDAASQLTDELFQLPIAAFGQVRLAHLPGLTGWENHARQAGAAKTSLLAGEPAQGSARAVLAGAIEASLASPEDNIKIHAALYQSLSADPARDSRPAGKKKARRRAARPTTSDQPFAHLTGRDVAEALILGDILLERRSH